MRAKFNPLVFVAAVAAAACGDDDRGPMMMGPSGASSRGFGAAFMSVTPAGGSTGVPISTSITVRFGAAMAVEHYVDLHVGDLAGPTIPLACTWSADRTTLACTPSAPLQPRTTYVIHLGGGMTTRSGAWIDYGAYGPMMGGQWVMGGMMGASHAGSPWGMMGSGWRHPNGSHGMAFPFTTG